MYKKECMISSKKPFYSLSNPLRRYLKDYNRLYEDLVAYDDLLRYAGAISIFDSEGEDTLWLRVYYREHERKEIDFELKRVYTTLMSDGNSDVIEHLSIDAIDYCSFGNSKPFRVKVRNILNDNYSYFYVKKFDASRVYGLELEHLLSPNHLNFLAYNDTLIEEHIIGIPGDVFMKKRLSSCSDLEKSQLAKEFVKFNERSFVRLLGDMRSYNYVIVPFHDFDHCVYKIRAIDFDQQSYEGNYKIYLPQFFKENLPMVSLVQEKLTESSINQYKVEERSVIAKRILSTKSRIENLLECMKNNSLSSPTKVKSLSRYFYNLTTDIRFKKSTSMGGILTHLFNHVNKSTQGVGVNTL
ncbi:MAG: hypothetical protein JKY02_06295 [Flavobacteriaceae bacterium]|nr:hypothetical protein [Flavobacteriaceae bacterium]